jgi:opacity protein-like surface antigen
MVKNKWLCVLSVCLMGSHASAQEPVSKYSDLYAFGQYGSLTVDVTGTEKKTDSLAAGLGYVVNKYLHAEVGYSNYGDAHANGTLVDAQSATAAAVGLYPLPGDVASLLGSFAPLLNGFALTGKLGMEYLHVKTEQQVTQTLGSNDTEYSAGAFVNEANAEIFYGIGAQYNVIKNIKVTAEYTVHNFTNGDVVAIRPDLNVFSLGINIPLDTFGF